MDPHLPARLDSLQIALARQEAAVRATLVNLTIVAVQSAREVADLQRDVGRLLMQPDETTAVGSAMAKPAMTSAATNEGFTCERFMYYAEKIWLLWMMVRPFLYHFVAIILLSVARRARFSRRPLLAGLALYMQS